MKTAAFFAALTVAFTAHALPNNAGSCAPTAEAAVARLLHDASNTGSIEGFRVDAVHHDTLRGRSWAVVASCMQPSLPHVAVLLPAGAVPTMVAHVSSPVIHVGDRVTVLSRSGESQMQFIGWAEEAGAPEQQIRVRLGVSLDAEHPALRLMCVVTRAGLVEVVR